MATYTGDLKDVGLASLAAYTPKLTVKPVQECWGPDGPISERPVTIALTGTHFEVDLVPSTQLTLSNGRVGVQYILECELLSPIGFHDQWIFTALPGGGKISDMIGVPIDPGPAWQDVVTHPELDARVAGLVDELSLVTEDALDERVDGLVDELDLTTLRKSVHFEGGRWHYDLPDNADSATHYLVYYDGRYRTASEPFPTPNSTTPAIAWQ